MSIAESILKSLAESEAAKEAIQKFEDMRELAIKSMEHFNNRLNTQDAALQWLITNAKESEVKVDKILFYLENPSDVVPAGEHKIAEVLESQNLGLCIVEGCHDQTIHDHGNGPVYGEPQPIVPVLDEAEKEVV